VTGQTRIDLDLGDTSVTLRVFPDGMWLLELEDDRVLMTREQCQRLMSAFADVREEQGWT